MCDKGMKVVSSAFVEAVTQMLLSRGSYSEVIGGQEILCKCYRMLVHKKNKCDVHQLNILDKVQKNVDRDTTTTQT